MFASRALFGRALHQGRPIVLTCLVLLLMGCSVFSSQPAPPPEPPITIVVGPVTMEAPIRKSTQIYSFETAPLPEVEPIIRKELLDEVQLKAQHLLTEHFAEKPGFKVIPFQDSRRFQADVERVGLVGPRTLIALAELAKADLAISARITAYGAVPWQYVATGLATETLAELLAVGFATGWNPAAVGSYFAVDFLLIDFPIWAGGAYIAGWAFRPVIVEAEVLQVGSCPGLIWSKQEEAIRIPGRRLDEYSPEERKRKEIQLQINLDRAMAEISEVAAESLRLQPCTQAGRPRKIRRWSFLPF